MSKEYIEKALVMQRIENESRLWGEEYEVSQILGDLEDFPPADVKPVVRGEWIDFGDELDKSAGRHSYQCSHCFTDASYFISGFEWDEWTAPHFCPNCGADMREEATT